MCNAIGIVNYEGPNVQVKGMQDYRPVSAFSFLEDIVWSTFQFLI